MATITENSLANDHTGARWMVPFIAVIGLMVAFTFAMLMYPYI